MNRARIIVVVVLLLTGMAVSACVGGEQPQQNAKGNRMHVETIVVGPLGVNCLLIDCGNGEGVIVDPGAESGRILHLAASRKLKIVHVINTHGHFDHVGGNKAVLEATGASLLIHPADVAQLKRAVEIATMYGLSTESSPPPDRELANGMRIAVGNTTIAVLHTPGHTPGGCSLYFADRGLVITGDTLFADSIGRTDLPGGSLETLVDSIKTKLYTLPDETVVIPGHGPSTTIGEEKRNNPYVR